MLRKVRSWESMEKEFGLYEDLGINCDILFLNDMKKYCGKEIELKTGKNGWLTDGNYKFTSCMLEPITFPDVIESYFDEPKPRLRTKEEYEELLPVCWIRFAKYLNGGDWIKTRYRYSDCTFHYTGKRAANRKDFCELTFTEPDQTNTEDLKRRAYLV